jgi:membrane-associated PAP2 superfamily phosphatase
MNDKIFKQSLLALCIAGILLTFLGRYTNIDITLADWMFDDSKREFIWRDNWFAVAFMHEAMKIALIAFGLALVILLITDRTIVPGFLADDTRRALHVVVASFVLVPLVISLLKASSIHACPWDLQRYGGDAPYLRFLDSLPLGAVAGHCFPAGHASAGLWLAAFAVFWLPRRPGWAVVVFTLGLIPGTILGWVQQLRGAHFLTHTLWSIWIACLVIALLARLLYPAKLE